MKLTTKTRYSLRILVQLALEKSGKPVKGKIISKRQKISEPYLEQIMIPLKTASLVKTVRGCNGGYTLNKSADTVSVLDIFELFEGKIEFSDCSDSQYKCPLKKTCMTSSIWKRLSNALATEAKSISLQDIIDEYSASGSGEYII